MRNLLWSGLVMALLLSGCGWDGTASRKNDFTPLTSITITADYSTIAQGTSAKLKAMGNFSGYFTDDISDQVTWTSDTKTVADFVTTAAPNRVTGLAPGSAVLTATMKGVSATYKLTVSSATPTAITITPADPTLAKGLTKQFTATGTFSDTTTQDLTFDATWASSDATVASVSDAAASKGLATSLAPGTTTISATFGGISGTTLLTATAPVLQSIAVTPANPSALSLTLNRFTATANYSDGTTSDITSQVTWASSNTSVTPAPTAGVTTTSAPGTTTISATLPGTISGSTTLTVTGGTLDSFSISPSSQALATGTMGRISATGVFSNNTTRDITGALTWTFDNPSRASLTTATGNVMWINALASGPVVITAKSASKSATASLTVTNTSFKNLNDISPANLTLTTGSTGRLTLSAVFNDGTPQNVTDNTTTAWSSDNSSVARVGTTGLASGQITAMATGKATITATYGGKSKTATITVTAKTPKSLAISPSTATNLSIGSATSFTATVTYSDNTTADVTTDTVWTVSNTNVAIPADSQQLQGQILGVNSGTATLTAKFGDTPAKTSVTLKVP